MYTLRELYDKHIVVSGELQDENYLHASIELLFLFYCYGSLRIESNSMKFVVFSVPTSSANHTYSCYNLTKVVFDGQWSSATYNVNTTTVSRSKVVDVCGD